MAAYDSDESELFLTQSKFSVQNCYNDNAVSGALIMEDEREKYFVQSEDISSDDGADDSAENKAEAVTASDEELKASCEVAEQSRFKLPMGDTKITELQSKRFADSTMSKLRWAVTLFKDWQSNRNKHALDPSNKLDISRIMVSLEDMTTDEINYSVSRFICEVKKMDGTEYPADTLYSLVISLQLYMDSIGKPYKFLNDESFIQIKNTLDNVMKSHARDPDARPRKQAEIITLGEEDFLWSKGVLGSENAKQLLNTMVYLIGLNFALRGGQEHRNLRSGPTSQLKLGPNEHGQYLSYAEDVSKTNQGGLKHRKCSPKSVVAFENTEKPTHCIVKLYEKYISHCPVPSDDDAPLPFYLRPLEKPRGNIWYSNQCVGRHKLAQTVADICKEAGLSGYRTNHSLRASAATRMFDAEVDEQLICEVTGHRSNAVRSYKRTNAAQKRKLSSIVQGQGQSECASSSTKSVHSEDSRENNGVSLTVNISVNKN